MSALTADKQMPPHRLQPAGGVVQTSTKKENTSMLAQDALTVESSHRIDTGDADAGHGPQPAGGPLSDEQAAVVATLDALQPGDCVSNGVAWYENAGPGLWSVDADSKTAEVLTSAQIVAAGVGEVRINRAQQSVKLPAGIVAPEVARFSALASAEANHWLFPKDIPDLFKVGPCPVWCTNEGHRLPTGYGVSRHTSRRLVVLYQLGYTWDDAPGYLCRSHFEVSLRLTAASRSGLPWVRLVREHREGEFMAQDLAPQEARELARALQAAADVADPDGEFEAAGDQRPARDAS